MNTYADHTDLTGQDLLEALAQKGGPFSIKMLANALTEGAPVKSSGDARYDYVRNLLATLSSNGLVSREKDGRTYMYSLTDDGREVLTSNDTAPQEDEDESPAPQEDVRDSSKVEADAPSPEEAQSDLDALISDAEGDGMDLDIPEPPTPSPQTEDTDTGTVTRTRLTVPKYNPDLVPDAPEGTTSFWSHRPDGTPTCEHSHQIISLDPVADGLVNEDGTPTCPEATKIRTECPYCGSIRTSRLNANGELKLHGHEVTSRDVAASMTHPFIRYTEETGLVWVLPSDDEGEDAPKGHEAHAAA